MSDRIRGFVVTLAYTWGSFWRKLEQGGALDVNGTLELEVGPLDEALREALHAAYMAGYAEATVAALDVQERRN